MENITEAEKNKMAATYGFLLGIIYIVLFTAGNMSAANLITYWVVKVAGGVIYFVLLGMFAARIRKANGGYAEFRELFGAIFVMLLIANLLAFVYGFIYMKFIDPDFMVKIKTGTMAFMEKMKVPEDKMEETSRKLDEQIEKSKVLNIGKSFLAFLGVLVFDSLVGLIVCAIVKKPRPINS